jgi:hypothetical protein
MLGLTGREASFADEAAHPPTSYGLILRIIGRNSYKISNSNGVVTESLRIRRFVELMIGEL